MIRIRRQMKMLQMWHLAKAMTTHHHLRLLPVLIVCWAKAALQLLERLCEAVEVWRSRHLLHPKICWQKSRF